MELFADLIKILVPSALLLYGMYLMAQTFLNKQFEQKQLEIKQKNTELLTPIRLQAYERLVLYLERITPNNMLIRLSQSGEQSLGFQHLLITEIREEYQHNIAQQLYMSHEAWEKVQFAMNEVIALINTSAAELPVDAPAIDLSKKVFENVITQNKQPTVEAIKFLKEEAQKELM